MRSMFATKSIEQLKAEQAHTGEHTPQARARARQSRHARHRRDHRHRHLRPDRRGGGGARRPAIVLSMVLAGIASALRRPLLRRVRVDGADRRLGLHLRLRDARRVHRLDHRLGPDPRVRARRGDRRGRLVGHLTSFLHDFVGMQFPAHLAPRPARSCRRAGGTVTAVFNLPGGPHHRRSSTILIVIGIKESATVNAVIVIIKVAVVLIVIVVGAMLRQPGELASVHPAEHRRRFGAVRLERHPAAAPASSSSPTSASTPCRSPRRKRRTRRRTCRSASSGRWSSARSSTSLVSGVMVGLVPYEQMLGIAGADGRWRSRRGSPPSGRLGAAAERR